MPGRDPVGLIECSVLFVLFFVAMNARAISRMRVSAARVYRVVVGLLALGGGIVSLAILYDAFKDGDDHVPVFPLLVAWLPLALLVVGRAWVRWVRDADKPAPPPPPDAP